MSNETNGAVPQGAPPAPDFNVVFRVSELQSMVNELGKMPYGQVAGVVDAIRNRCRETEAAVMQAQAQAQASNSNPNTSEGAEVVSIETEKAS